MKKKPSANPHAAMSATAQPLLTQTSAALSLSPPRAPPHGSASRSMYHRTTMPLHPHLPASPSLPDRTTRLIGTALPLHIQHSLRDAGGLRSLVDSMVTLSCPLVGVAGRWEGVRDFLALSRLPCGDGDDGGDCGRGDDDDGVASSSSSRAEGEMDSPGGESGGGGDGGRTNRDARGRRGGGVGQPRPGRARSLGSPVRSWSGSPLAFYEVLQLVIGTWKPRKISNP